jgi:hypothetical protein
MQELDSEPKPSHPPPRPHGRNGVLTVVRASIADGRLRLELQGLRKLWVLQSRMEIPLERVRSVRVEPELARTWLAGLCHSPGPRRLPTPGTLSREGERLFWDVADPDHTIVIAVTGEPYHELVVEVERPAEVLGLIAGAGGGH